MILVVAIEPEVPVFPSLVVGLAAAAGLLVALAIAAVFFLHRRKSRCPGPGRSQEVRQAEVWTPAQTPAPRKALEKQEESTYDEMYMEEGHYTTDYEGEYLGN